MKSLIFKLYELTGVPYNEYGLGEMPHFIHETQEGCFWDGETLQLASDASEMTLLHEYAHYVTSVDLSTFSTPNYGLDRESFTHINLEMDACEISFALAYLLGLSESQVLEEMELTGYNTNHFKHWIFSGFNRVRACVPCRRALEELISDNRSIAARFESVDSGNF